MPDRAVDLQAMQARVDADRLLNVLGVYICDNCGKPWTEHDEDCSTADRAALLSLVREYRATMIDLAHTASWMLDELERKGWTGMEDERAEIERGMACIALTTPKNLARELSEMGTSGYLTSLPDATPEGEVG